MKNENNSEEIITPLIPIKEEDIVTIKPTPPLEIDYQILKSQIDLQYSNYFQNLGDNLKESTKNNPQINFNIEKFQNISFEQIYSLEFYGICVYLGAHQSNRHY
jgi:hypothetical protein